MKPTAKILFAVFCLAGYFNAYAKFQPPTVADTLVKVNPHLSGFTAIKIAGPFDVHISQGEDESVMYEAGADVMDRIHAVVDDHVLKIRNKHDNWGQGHKSWYSEKSVWHNHKKIVVHIIVKDISSITISGSGDAIFETPIAANSLRIRVRGSGNIGGKVDIGDINSHISGSGTIKLTGAAKNSNVLVRGSGNFSTRDLATGVSAVYVSGSGRAEVNASDKVNVIVRGSGDVSYNLNAKVVNTKKSGSGNIGRF